MSGRRLEPAAPGTWQPAVRGLNAFLGVDSWGPPRRLYFVHVAGAEMLSDQVVAIDRGLVVLEAQHPAPVPVDLELAVYATPRTDAWGVHPNRVRLLRRLAQLGTLELTETDRDHVAGLSLDGILVGAITRHRGAEAVPVVAGPNGVATSHRPEARGDQR